MENVKKKTFVSLTVEQRLDRLERLMVKALMSLVAPNPALSRLINTDHLPMSARMILYSTYYPGQPKYNAEAESTVESILTICSDEIAEQQAKLDADKAKVEADRIAQEREAAQAEFEAAEKQRKEAREKLDKLEPKSLS